MSNQLTRVAVLPVVVGALLACGDSSAVANDSAVFRMCGNKPAKQCECAAEKLNGAIAPDDYQLYEAVGQIYLDNQDAGVTELSEAWDAAVDEISKRRGIGKSNIYPVTNKAGREHRKAIRACR